MIVSGSAIRIFRRSIGQSMNAARGEQGRGRRSAYRRVKRSTRSAVARIASIGISRADHSSTRAGQPRRRRR